MLEPPRPILLNPKTLGRMGTPKMVSPFLLPEEAGFWEKILEEGSFSGMLI
jgi:hypothetical protein